MNIDVFRQHLESKENLTDLEKISLGALNDTKFLEQTTNLIFLKSLVNQENVFNNPQSYDSPDNEFYMLALTEITNIYRGYLYDTKGKYTSIKSDVDEINKSLATAKTDIENIESVSKVISGEKVLSVYAKEFKKRSKGYLRAAKRWQKWLIWSYIVLSVVVVLAFTMPLVNSNILNRIISQDLKIYPQIAILLFKALIILAAVQLSRFFTKNYNASMHLYHQTLHKYDVLRSLQGIYNTISNENLEARDELIKAAAIIAFQNIESGYITVKEGAGGAEGHIDAILSSVFKVK